MAGTFWHLDGGCGQDHVDACGRAGSGCDVTLSQFDMFYVQLHPGSIYSDVFRVTILVLLQYSAVGPKKKKRQWLLPLIGMAAHWGFDPWAGCITAHLVRGLECVCVPVLSLLNYLMDCWASPVSNWACPESFQC